MCKYTHFKDSRIFQVEPVEQNLILSAEKPVYNDSYEGVL
jgi:hypothetical protein